MQIINLKPEEIVPYENNPRMNAVAADYVEKSIRRFGFRVPIVIDENRVIVCGHTRFEAAKRIGLETIPCVMADGLTEDEIRAFRIVDNRSNEYATWDFDLLQTELDEIKIDLADFDLKLKDEDALPLDALENEDAEPTPPEKYQVIVDCPGEDEMLSAFRRITDLGIECRCSSF